MAAGDLYIFPKFHELWVNGTTTFDFDSTTINLALFRASVTAQINAGLSYYGSVTAEEVTAGTAYIAGGAALTSKSISISSSFTLFMAGDVSWAQDAAGFATARWAILYKNTATPGTSPVIALLDLGSAQSNVSGSFGVNWNASGILKVSGTALPAT